MIISHRYRYIFIRCRKTASTSTEIVLSKYVDNDDIVTPIAPRDDLVRRQYSGRGPQNCWQTETPIERVTPMPLRFRNHMPAREIKAQVGPHIWNSYFKFCFERNPWDKAISLYFHRYKQEPRPPFAEFVASDEVLDARNAPLYLIDGAVAVDHVCRFERLDAELFQVARLLGLPALGPMPRAKAQFRRDRRPYQEVIDSDSRARIERGFRDELSLWGYTW